MSVKWHVRPSLVALTSNASVHEVVRAIEHSNIGAVVVHDAGRAVGVRTLSHPICLLQESTHA